jgi:adenylate kinase
MGVTLVSGVPGVGSSAVCRGARRSLGGGYELLNFGDAMLEQALTRGLARSRDELPTLTVRETRRLQRRAGEYVADRARATDVILNTHLAVETEHGYLPGLPESVLADVAPSAFVLVEAAPETIRERRAEADREYDEDSLREVAFEQDLNRAAAVSYAMTTGAPIRLVENDGDLAAAAATLAEAVVEGASAAESPTA